MPIPDADEEIAQLLERCADAGVTTIDMADIYGHHDQEPAVGRALKLRPGLRERLTLVTKVRGVGCRAHPCDCACPHWFESIEWRVRDGVVLGPARLVCSRPWHTPYTHSAHTPVRS